MHVHRIAPACVDMLINMHMKMHMHTAHCLDYVDHTSVSPYISLYALFLITLPYHPSISPFISVTPVNGLPGNPIPTLTVGAQRRQRRQHASPSPYASHCLANWMMRTCYETLHVITRDSVIWHMGLTSRL